MTQIKGSEPFSSCYYKHQSYRHIIVFKVLEEVKFFLFEITAINTDFYAHVKAAYCTLNVCVGGISTKEKLYEKEWYD